MLSGRKGPKGVEIDGIVYTIAPVLFESGIFEDEDCSKYSDFGFSMSESSNESNDLEDHHCHTSMTESESSDEDSSTEELDCRSRYKKGCDYDKMKKEKDCSTSEDEKHSQSCLKNKRLKLSPELPKDVKEEIMQPQEIYGYYFCEVCNLELSSEKVYNDHMNGQRHRKNLKVKDVDMAVRQAIPLFSATEGMSRYPQPPPGVIRRRVKQRAKIQDIIAHEIKKPCPGLNLVTEIQGLKETQYYCSICNSNCSSNSILAHLTGFKHQLHLVKHFRPGDYENIHPEYKNMVKDRIIGILRAIEKKNGLGRMTVEVEEFACESNDIKYEMSHRSHHITRNVQETSLKCSGMSFSEYYSQSTIPNKLAPDFYCEHCDSHMNSEDMWKSHIAGKRHIANLKKLPGERPSKAKTIPLRHLKSRLIERLENECSGEPIVGLDKIKEIHVKPNSESYNCYICSSYHTSMDIIDHLVSLKHRKKYLDFINYPYMQHISGMSERSQAPIVRNICCKIEEREGRSNPSVHLNKSSYFG